MLFPTFDFLLFIIPVLLLSWAFSHAQAIRIPLLIGASYFFYMAGPLTDPLPAPWYFAGLLVFSTFLDYFASRAIWRENAGLDSPDPDVAEAARKRRNLWLGLSLAGNLGLLGYFKYTNFFLEAFSGLFLSVAVLPALVAILMATRR